MGSGKKVIYISPMLWQGEGAYSGGRVIHDIFRLHLAECRLYDLIRERVRIFRMPCILFHRSEVVNPDVYFVDITHLIQA